MATYKLTKARRSLIKKAFDRGHDLETIKKAITGMSTDDWDKRDQNNDLQYAMPKATIVVR